MGKLILDKLKRYIISLIIFILTIQSTFVGGLFQLEKAKAIDPGTNIYATDNGGSTASSNNATPLVKSMA